MREHEQEYMLAVDAYNDTLAKMREAKDAMVEAFVDLKHASKKFYDANPDLARSTD